MSQVQKLRLFLKAPSPAVALIFISCHCCTAEFHLQPRLHTTNMHLILCHLLLISSLFYTSVGIMEGCDNWDLSDSGVCCTKCHPGNRLVKSCGEDPTKLCTPCDAGTFVTNPKKRFCSRCDQCIDPQVVKEPCTPSSDTVCGCKDGYRCGNLQCSYCVEECGKGKEPTEERTCKECPEGTFNDKIHSKCQRRRTSCPEGEKLVVTGNISRDNECRGGVPSANAFNTVEILPTKSTKEAFNTVEILPAKSKQKEDMVWPIVGTAVGIFVVTMVVIGILAFGHRRIKDQTKVKTEDPTSVMLPQEEQDDSWSFRQPEQEQGGSSESISTQDSETKLIV